MAAAGEEAAVRGCVAAAGFAYLDHRRIPVFVRLAGIGGMIAVQEPENLPAGMRGYDPDHIRMAEP